MTEPLPGGKLVRDRIPEIIRQSGRQPVVRRLAPEEFRAALFVKLAEESAELAAAAGGEVVGELADVLEVLRAVADHAGVGWAEVESHARAKRLSRGGFGERWLLEHAPEEPAAQRAAED